MGFWDHAEVAKKRLRNASNYIRKKCLGSSYTLGRFSRGYRKSLRILCGYSSRRFSSVSRHVLTLQVDRLSLPEKRMLKLKTQKAWRSHTVQLGDRGLGILWSLLFSRINENQNSDFVMQQSSLRFIAGRRPNLIFDDPAEEKRSQCPGSAFSLTRVLPCVLLFCKFYSGKIKPIIFIH